MLITNTWVEVATVGAILQKLGTNALSIQYSAGAPNGTGTSFALTHNNAEIYPEVTSKTLWARAFNGDITLAIEDLA
jgi:hypothetical protein